MRTGAKVFGAVVIPGVLAYGLLGPVAARGSLQDKANNAAKAGYAQMLSNGSPHLVEQAVTASLGHQSNIRVKSVAIKDSRVSVVLEEKVHSFMSGFPGLKGWFIVSVTESASALG